MAIVPASAALLFAAFASFRLWRSTTAGEDRLTRAIVTAGFLLRAAGGAVLVLIAVLRLPVAPSLHGPDGLWFFAIDGSLYLSHAADAAREGLPAILTRAPNVPASAYVQALALFVWSFGESPAVGVLLNLFSYLGINALVLRWARSVAAPRQVVLFTVAVLSLSPSSILWALQPLKESFFQFILIAVLGAAFAWQRALQHGRMRALLLASIAFLGALFVLAGVRWYVAIAVLAGCVPFMAVAFRNARRAWLALLLLPLLLLGARAVAVSGGSFILPTFRSALLLDREGLRTLPLELSWIIPQVRENLARLGGDTAILTADRTVPASHAERLGTGALATFVPRTLLARFDLLYIPGGRGLWLFADLDTLFFDAALLAAIALCFRRRSASPVFWLIVTAVVLVGVALMYAMPNFGTLFRLRLILLTACALLPLAWRSGAEQVREEILDPADADDLDVRVDLGAVRVRDQHAAEA